MRCCSGNIAPRTARLSLLKQLLVCYPGSPPDGFIFIKWVTSRRLVMRFLGLDLSENTSSCGCPLLPHKRLLNLPRSPFRYHSCSQSRVAGLFFFVPLLTCYSSSSTVERSMYAQIEPALLISAVHYLLSMDIRRLAFSTLFFVRFLFALRRLVLTPGYCIGEVLDVVPSNVSRGHIRDDNIVTRSLTC